MNLVNTICSFQAGLRRPAAQANPTLVFLCFHTKFEWWDGCLPAGTAGSEEAVVEMARRLATRGWTVLVYNNCGAHARAVSSVLYKPLRQYDPEIPVDVTIIWRSPELCDWKIRSPKTYLWLQDITLMDSLTPTRLARLTKVIVLSHFHRSTLPSVPDNKILRSRNGISVRALEAIRSHAGRNHRKCIYTSAPDRGLECLLLLWPRIRERVPGSELHVFYGWDVWDYFNSEDQQALQWKNKIISMLAQPGVMTNFSHVMPEYLSEEYLTSAVWTYPTEFRETSCISAMKAQASGAFPVTTNVAALDETVRWGAKIQCSDIYTNERAQQTFVDVVVEYLSIPNEVIRDDMMGWAKKSYSWDSVADQWDTEFRSNR